MRLDKEVIAFLSDNKLDLLRGVVVTVPSIDNCEGTKTFNACGGPDTFHSNCICMTKYEKTCPEYTKQYTGCAALVSISQAEMCCNTNKTCDPFIPLSKNGEAGCVIVQTYNGCNKTFKCYPGV